MADKVSEGQTEANAINETQIMHKLAKELFIPHLQRAVADAKKTGSTNLQIVGAASNAFTFMLEDAIGPKATAELMQGMADKLKADIKKHS